MFSCPNGVAAPWNPLHSAMLRSEGQARLGILAGGRKVWGSSFMDPKSIRLLAPVGLDSRIPEASLCCALRAKRGLALWRGGPITLPRKGDVRNRPELSQFQMKFCIGEAFLEAQAGFPDFLAKVVLSFSENETVATSLR